MRIERRFCGPATSGNGGYTAGRLAAYLDGPAEVTLRRPPPLERELAVERRESGVALLDGQTLVAEAVPAVVDLPVPVPEPVGLDVAAEAAQRCPTIVHPEWHPFPSCFVCGPDRDEGDGLRVFPGPVDGRDVFAAPVAIPAEPVFMWAALDCPSSFVMYRHGVRPETPYVLGRLAVGIDILPGNGEPLVVLAWLLGSEGRKLFSASALFDADGTRHAIARATWISV